MSEKDIDVLARTVWAEARGEGVAGQVAVGRRLRVRLGWRIMTDKFERYGFAQLVNTCNPFDGYGDD